MTRYIPTPPQRLFHLSVADELLYGGAAGGGKSAAIVMEALAQCLEPVSYTHLDVYKRQLYRLTTKPYFRTCSTCLSCSQAPFCLCTL